MMFQATVTMKETPSERLQRRRGLLDYGAKVAAAVLEKLEPTGISISKGTTPVGKFLPTDRGDA